MKLSILLDPKNNNLDLFRLIAAALVIYGHAYALNPVAGANDFVQNILFFDYSGSLAVKIFFFISGLVVANSLIGKSNLIEYAISRFFRIVPGLIFILFISAFVIGPILSEYSLQDYFKEEALYSYFFKNIIFHTNYVLPGVFKNNPYPDAVNGSLWTLPYEIASYILLFALYAIGIFKSRFLVLFVLALILIDPFTGNKVLFTWRATHNAVDFMSPCFALGAAAAYFKNYLDVNFKGVIGLFFIYWIFKQSTIHQLIFYVATFYAMLYACSLPLAIKLKPRIDLSYGVYLWGFLIQQTLVNIMPSHSIIFNQLIALTCSLMIAWISWTFIEARGIKAGNELKHWLRMRQAIQ